MYTMHYFKILLFIIMTVVVKLPVAVWQVEISFIFMPTMILHLIYLAQFLDIISEIRPWLVFVYSVEIDLGQCWH